MPLPSRWAKDSCATRGSTKLPSTIGTPADSGPSATWPRSAWALVIPLAGKNFRGIDSLPM